MKKTLVRIGIAVVVLLVVGLGVLWFSLNSIVKKGVETVGSYLTKTEVRLDSVSLSPFSGRGELMGLFVGSPEGYKAPSAIEVGKLSVALDVSSLKSDKIRVNSVVIDAPYITLEGGVLKDNNLSQILANLKETSGAAKTEPAGQASGATKKAGRKIQVDDLVIHNAQVHVILFGAAAAPVVIPDIHLTNLGTGGDGITVAEATTRVFDELMTALIPAVKDNALKLGKDLGETAKGLTKEATSTLEKATQSIPNPFKK